MISVAKNKNGVNGEFEAPTQLPACPAYRKKSFGLDKARKGEHVAFFTLHWKQPVLTWAFTARDHGKITAPAEGRMKTLSSAKPASVARRRGGGGLH